MLFIECKYKNSYLYLQMAVMLSVMYTCKFGAGIKLFNKLQYEILTGSIAYLFLF
jgi:hypothetical protein